MIDLLRNPFAVLGVTVQDTPAAIRRLVETTLQGGGLPEVEARAAELALLGPETRLEAEVSWLLGRSAPRVAAILASLRKPPSTKERLALLASIDGVARANLAAHACAVERGGVSLVRALVEAQNGISPEAVFWLINGNREIAGFPPITEADLWTALAALQSRHCAAVCEAISARKEHRQFMVCLFADGWSPAGPAYAFLERVVAAYDAWYDAHLAAVGNRLEVHLNTLAANPADAAATEGVKTCLALWDEYAEPLKHPAIDDSAVVERGAAIHGKISALCTCLAREHWRFRTAIQLAESLAYAFPDATRADLRLPETLDALRPMLSRVRGASVPQELYQAMADLAAEPATLAKSLERGEFRRGGAGIAGQLFAAFAESMAAAHGTPLGEGAWIMLRCLALDLDARHGKTAGAAALLDGLLAVEDDYLMPAEFRRLLESDATLLRHAGHRRRLNDLMARGRLRQARRLVEELLLHPPEENAHDALIQVRGEIEKRLARRAPWRRLWLLSAGLLAVGLMVTLAALVVR